MRRITIALIVLAVSVSNSYADDNSFARQFREAFGVQNARLERAVSRVEAVADRVERSADLLEMRIEEANRASQRFLDQFQRQQEAPAIPEPPAPIELPDFQPTGRSALSPNKAGPRLRLASKLDDTPPEFSEPASDVFRLSNHPRLWQFDQRWRDMRFRPQSHRADSSPNLAHPWSRPAGTHGMRRFSVSREIHLPRGSNILRWHESVRGYRGIRRGSTYIDPEHVARWLYPIGTKVIERLSETPTSEPFVERTRAKVSLTGWQSNVEQLSDTIPSGFEFVSEDCESCHRHAGDHITQLPQDRRGFEWYGHLSGSDGVISITPEMDTDLSQRVKVVSSRPAGVPRLRGAIVSTATIRGPVQQVVRSHANCVGGS